jgi:hypothetical protein
MKDRISSEPALAGTFLYLAIFMDSAHSYQSEESQCNGKPSAALSTLDHPVPTYRDGSPGLLSILHH